MNLKKKKLLLFFLTFGVSSYTYSIDYSEALKNTFFAAVIAQITFPLIKNILSRTSKGLSGTRVGLISIKGPISSSAPYIKILHQFFEDKSIKAILLFIDSPGGAAASSEAIANELIKLKQLYPKPIITLCENSCASGAYYIAACTDFIIAPPSCFVGSIGVYIPTNFNFKEFLEDHHIYYNAIYAGDYKLAGDGFTELTENQKDYLEDLAERSYIHFVQHVLMHRNVDINQTDVWANGKILTALQGFDVHLVDFIGSWSDAVQKIKELASIKNTIIWVRPKQQRGWWNFFIPNNDEVETISPLNTIIEKLIGYFSSAHSSKNMMLRME